MCKRCAEVNRVMREAVENTSMAGAGNIVAKLGTDIMVLAAQALQHVLPESMFNLAEPYKTTAELMGVIVAGLEFELTVPLADLPHDAPAAPFSTTPIVDDTPIDADYTVEEPKPTRKPPPPRQQLPAPASEEDRKLMAEGDDILRDMLGEK